MEFLNAYHRAKFPLGGDTIPKAWRLAQESPIPPEAEQFENPEIKRLVALCWQLQILSGEKPFYLSSRVCQKLFDHPSHSTLATWLGGMVTLGILEVVEPGNQKRATRYRYLGITSCGQAPIESKDQP
ncbi:MAG: hypothetical protein ACREP9_11515 [Candidatus Dormibacteraceae bacterium]